MFLCLHLYVIMAKCYYLFRSTRAVHYGQALQTSKSHFWAIVTVVHLYPDIRLALLLASSFPVSIFCTIVKSHSGSTFEWEGSYCDLYKLQNLLCAGFGIKNQVTLSSS